MGIVDSVKQELNQHAPAYLAALAFTGWATGTVLAVKATPKAMEDIEAKKKELGTDDLSIWDTVGACWKRYIWAAAAATFGTASMIGSVAEGEKKYASVLAANDLLMNSIREYADYRKNTEEQLGKKKEQEIYKQTQEQQMAQNPPTPQNTLVRDPFVQGTPGGPICYFPDFGIYVYASYDDVKAAVNKAGSKIVGSIGGTACLNDIFEEIHAKSTTVGDYLGWNLDTGVPQIPEKEDIIYSGTPVTGDPCWVCPFVNFPQYEYQFFRY